MTGTVAPQAIRPASQVGGADGVLTDEQVREFVHEQLAAVDLDGRSVCVLVPDGTRSCPMPLLLGAVHEALHGRVSRLTVLVALGTHSRMGETELARHLGYPPGGFEERYPGATVLNHEWWDPHTFASVGTISGRAARGAVRGPLPPPVGAGAAEPRRRRARRHPGRRAGIPARGGRLLRRQQVLLPRYLQPGGHQRLALARRADHQCRDHRHPWHHAGPRDHRRGGLAGARGQARVLRRGQVRIAGAAFGGLRRAAGGLGRGRGRGRRDTRPLPRRAGTPGAVDHPAHVPRHLDGGEGLLQGRAGGRRRRPGGDLRPARARRSPPPIRRSTRSATTAGTTS